MANINNLIYEFGKYLGSAAGGNASSNTIRNYSSSIRQFESFAKKDVTRATESDIIDFLRQLQYIGKKNKKTKAGTDISTPVKILSASAVRVILFALRSFYKYLKDIKQVIQINPTEKIVLPATVLTKQKRMQYLGWIWIDKLVQDSKLRTNITGLRNISMLQILRNEAILQILCKCGLTVQELLNLKVADIDTKEPRKAVITLPGKYGNRQISLSGSDSYTIKKWLIARKKLRPPNDSVFVCTKRSQDCLTYRSIDRIVSEAGRLSKFRKKISPKMLRISFVVNTLNDYGDKNLSAKQNEKKLQKQLKKNSTLVYKKLENI
ncbi:MAG: tyrosine-type recombinase/integrase [Elusimicrobiota bacterium]